MALGILHTTHNNLPSGTSATLSFTTTPTTGNLLVVFLSVQDSASVVTGPGGLAALDWIKAGGVGARLFSFAFVVQSGDTNSYVFTCPNSLDRWNFIGYEVTGQAASSYINQHGIANLASTGTVITTPSKTPSVLGTLVLSGLGSNNSGTVLNSVSSGWTNDVSLTGMFHPAWGASRNALTSDTTTAITNTFTVNSADGLMAAVVFVAPPLASGGTNSLPLLGCQ